MRFRRSDSYAGREGIERNHSILLRPAFLFLKKEVRKMLMIQQIYEPDNRKYDYVKCPACKRGRLCDKPAGDKVVAFAIESDPPSDRSSRIILKCPKCSQKFIIGFTKE